VKQPWAAWLGLFTFGESIADLETLGGIAQISAQLRSPFFGGASPKLVGCDSFHLHPDADTWTQPISAEFKEAWAALRGLPEAEYLALALPRFLLRQPYGKDSDPIDSFPFEELIEGASHESYLWGNPALACAYVLAAAFQAEGWDMQANGYGEVEDLPVYRFRQDGEMEVKPCAEAWLTDRGAEVVMREGLVPLLSIKGRNAIRVGGLQTLAGTALRFH
jgi:type VI secretion system protein ImpC